jgi:hypothetical protein
MSFGIGRLDLKHSTFHSSFLLNPDRDITFLGLPVVAGHIFHGRERGQISLGGFDD